MLSFLPAASYAHFQQHRARLNLVLGCGFFLCFLFRATAQTPPATKPGVSEPSSTISAADEETAARGLATVTGIVTDPSGALLPHAQVHLAGSGEDRAETTDEAARFTVHAPPGQYELRVESAGFAPFHRTVQLQAGQKLTVKATLPIVTHNEEMSVAEESNSSPTDPSANRDALIFNSARLATFSNDDSTLQRQMLAMVGGGEPGSAQIFVDGFSGARFPPKNTIREIRINQNPFSAQYDRSGMGRIEVFTKPGSNKLHGSANVSGNDRTFNASNPYTGVQPPYHSETLDADLNGSLKQRTSFFLGTSVADNQSNTPVNAVVLDANFAPVAISQPVPNPQTSHTYSLRLDRQLTEKDTLIGRYEYNSLHLSNGGVGQLTLASQGFSSDNTTQTLQVGNTFVYGQHLVNETRFQYIRNRFLQTANDGSPSLIVQGAFNGGGSPAQTLRNNIDSYEFQEYLSLDRGKHFVRAGARYRLFRNANLSTANYNGQYIFPTLTAYQITLRGQQQGLSAAAIRALGGGATQFNLTAGIPSAKVLTGDLGAYFEDEWKPQPHFTLTAGVRLETQTAIPDHFDPAPRVAFSWAVGNRHSEPPLLVVRGGAGFFYDRFAPGNILQTIRQNGVSQRPYYVESPDFFPSIPDPSSLPSLQPTVYKLDPRFRSLTLLSSNLSAEHTWSKRGTVAATLTVLRAWHMPLSENINAPLPGTYAVGVPGSGVRPFGGTQNIYQYTSEGVNSARTLHANTTLNLFKNTELWGVYLLQWRRTDVSGANSFPSNQYNLAADYGRSAFLTKHRFYVGLSSELPHGFSANLFVSAHSGPPFNITIGQDVNGDTQFNDRPAFATDLTRPSVVRTAFGNFDTLPLPSQTVIPINYGNSPAYVFVQAQVGKTFQVGPRGPAPAAGVGSSKTGLGTRKYQLGFSAEANNLFNHNNPAQPIGVLSSPFFGRSIALAGEDSDSTAANRFIRLYASFRF